MKAAEEASCLQSLHFAPVSLFPSTVPPRVPILLSLKLSGNGMLDFIHRGDKKIEAAIPSTSFSEVAQGLLQTGAGRSGQDGKGRQESS